MKGDDHGRLMNVIVMNRESGHRHDKWCHSLYSVLSLQRIHRQRDSLRSAHSKYIDKVIDNGFHCESSDRLQITWSSLDILKWSPLDIVDAVFDFFGDFNQSLAPKRIVIDGVCFHRFLCIFRMHRFGDSGTGESDYSPISRSHSIAEHSVSSIQ